MPAGGAHSSIWSAPGPILHSIKACGVRSDRKLRSITVSLRTDGGRRVPAWEMDGAYSEAYSEAYSSKPISSSLAQGRGRLEKPAAARLHQRTCFEFEKKRQNNDFLLLCSV